MKRKRKSVMVLLVCLQFVYLLIILSYSLLQFLKPFLLQLQCPVSWDPNSQGANKRTMLWSNHEQTRKTGQSMIRKG